MLAERTTSHPQLIIAPFALALLAAGLLVAVDQPNPTAPPGPVIPVRVADHPVWPAPPGTGPGELHAAPPPLATPPPPPDTLAPAEAPGPEPEPAGAPPPVVNKPPDRPNRAAPEPAPDAGSAAGGQASAAVHPVDFPDPFVIRAQGAYWAFSTQRGLRQVPTMRSADLMTWEEEGDALPRLPEWASFGHVWAPSLLARGTGFVMYYTTKDTATGLQCISQAFSVIVQGPYLDTSDGPMICQTERGGSIDPDPFVDADGQPWLLWKSEGTLLGEPTRIWTQRLAPDGRSLLGEPTQLLSRSLPWEEPIIEGPAMVLVDGRHHLFYAGNRWETGDYAIGHAVCETAAGPCRRTGPAPVLASRRNEAGPGSPALIAAPDGELVLAHHAWDPAAIGYPHGARRLHVSAIAFEGDRVTVGGPWRPEPFRLL